MGQIGTATARYAAVMIFLLFLIPIAYGALTAPTTPTASSPLAGYNSTVYLTSNLPFTGTPPYVYSWLLSVNGSSFQPDLNDSTLGLTYCGLNYYNAFGTSTLAGNSVSCTFAVNPQETSEGLYAFEVQIFDSNTNTTISNSVAVTVGPALLTERSTSVFLGQNEIYSIYVANTMPPFNGSKGPFNVIFQDPDGVSFPTLTLNSIPPGGITLSKSLNFSAFGSPGNIQLNATVQDIITHNSVTTPTILTEINLPPPLSTPTKPVLSANALDVGEPISVSASVYNGVPPYTYNWFIINATSGAVVFNSIYTGITKNSNTLTIQLTGTFPSNSPLEANVVVRDSYNAIANSVYSSLFMVNSAPATPAITSIPALPATLDQGQAISFTATASGGTTPYTYDYTLTNTITQTVVTNVIYTNVYSPSNTFSWISAASPQTLKANVIITDSQSKAVNSIYTQVLTVKAALLAGSLSESNSVIDSGQSSTLSSNPSGGTGSYSINWFTQSGCTGATVGTSNTISVSPVSTTTYSYNVVDSIAVSACSSGNSITVHSAPSLSIPLASNSVLDLGQSTTYSTTLSGGTGPFTVNLIKSGAVVNSITVSSAGIVVFASNIPSSGTSSFNVMAIDTGTTTPLLFSSASNTINVNTAFAASSTPVASNSAIDSGQYSTLSISAPTTGTAPYLYQWYSGSSPTCTNDAPVSSQTGIVYAASPTQLTYYCVKEIDSATSQSIAYTATRSVLASNAPTLSQPSPSNSVLDLGQYITYTTTLSGGIGPFTLNLVAAGNVVSTITTPSPGLITFGINAPPIGVSSYNVMATDLGSSSAYFFNSIADAIVVNTYPSESTSASTNPILDLGQSTTLTTVISGGSGPFTSNLIYSNSIVAQSVSGIATGGTATFTFTPTTSNTYNFKVLSTDTGASTPISFNNILSSVAVHASPTATSLTPSNSVITLGQGVTFNVLISGGAGPFTLMLISANGSVVNTISGASAGIATFGKITPLVSPSIYNVIGIDTGTTSPLTFNSSSNSVIVNNAPPSTTTTTTIPQSNIGGGGSGSSGGGGGGGSSLPTLSQAGSCYIVGNLAVPNTAGFTLNKTQIGLTTNFIGPNQTGVTINGNSETLLPNQPQSLFQSGGYKYTAELTSISYIPIEHSVVLQICSSPTSSTQNPATSSNQVTVQPQNATNPTLPAVGIKNLTVTNDTTSNSIKLTAALTGFGGEITVLASSNSSLPHLNVTTPSYSELPSNSPSNYSYLVTALNITTTTTSNVLITATLKYSCAENPSKLKPFILKNGDWEQIHNFTFNKTACAISFAIPADPIIAIFSSVSPSNGLKTTSVPPSNFAPITTVGTQTAGPLGSLTKYRLLADISWLAVLWIVFSILYVSGKQKRATKRKPKAKG